MHNQSASHSSSLTHFKHFVERIMSAPEEHDGKVCIGDRTLTNLRFAEYIGAVAEWETEALEALLMTLKWRHNNIDAPLLRRDIMCLLWTKSAQGIKWRLVLKRTKLMTYNANGIRKEIKVKG